MAFIIAPLQRLEDRVTASHLAFVFPGQGSQSLGMLAELGAQQALIRDTFGEAFSKATWRVDPRLTLEGGLRVGTNWNQGTYDLAVFGRNITDSTRIVGGIDFNNLTGFINEPRTWGVEFTARF